MTFENKADIIEHMESIHQLGPDHVISTGRQMTNLVLNFEYLLLLCFLTAAEF